MRGPSDKARVPNIRNVQLAKLVIVPLESNSISGSLDPIFPLSYGEGNDYKLWPHVVILEAVIVPSAERLCQ
jgi:hypothetical protein